MSTILGDWTVSKDVKQFTNGLVDKGDVVSFTKSNGRAAIKVMRGGAVVFESLDVLTISGTEDSVYGSFGIGPSTYYVVAYIREFGDHVYIFGNARKHTPADDSGGQWDGNRPK